MNLSRQNQIRKPANFHELPSAPDERMESWWSRVRESVDRTIAWVVDQIPGRVTTAADGLAPKLPGDAGKFLAGDGSWKTVESGPSVPVDHTHSMESITGLTKALDDLESKVPTDVPPHTHKLRDITDYEAPVSYVPMTY